MTISEDEALEQDRSRGMDISGFMKSYNYKEPDVSNFKRWRGRVSFTDRILFVIFSTGLVVFAIFYLLDILSWGPDNLMTALAILIGLLALSMFVVLPINLLYAAAIWYNDFDSEKIAGFELCRAIEDYQELEDNDVDNILYHLKEADKFLKYRRKHKVIAPEHASDITRYINNLENSKDLHHEIQQTFPQFLQYVCQTIYYPRNPRFESVISEIETDPTISPGKMEGIKRDGEALLGFLIKTREGPILLASSIGIGVGIYAGVWQGATVLFGILTLYGFIQDRIA